MAGYPPRNDTPDTPVLLPEPIERIVLGLQPVLGPIARRTPALATITHRGRVTGRSFRTPVRAFRGDGVLAVAMIHGTTDWVRNILAAGQADVASSGADLHIVNPRIVPVGGDADGLPDAARRALRRSAILVADIGD
ncbi:nitroreductase family deazaflavin-dependent oxidoreductase [Gordonia sp. NPDC003376]